MGREPDGAGEVPVKLEEIVLENRLYSISQVLSDREQQSARMSSVSQYYDIYLRGMVVNLTRSVWSRRIGLDTIEYPADWWQAFKERFFPAWMIRRWPVKMTTVNIEAWHEYPGLEIKGEKPLLRLHRLLS